MTEWPKVHAWKACVLGNRDRGFESRLLRQVCRGVDQTDVDPPVSVEVECSVMENMKNGHTSYGYSRQFS